MSDVPPGLITALEKLPPFTGVTWRGAPGALVRPIELPVPLPTSLDPRVASANFTVPTLWAVLAVAGRDIGPLSADPAAREVTLLPGSTLVPGGDAHEVAGVTVQLVREVRDGVVSRANPPDADLAAVLEAFRAEGVVEIRQPGRFG